MSVDSSFMLVYVPANPLSCGVGGVGGGGGRREGERERINEYLQLDQGIPV